MNDFKDPLDKKSQENKAQANEDASTTDEENASSQKESQDAKALSLANHRKFTYKQHKDINIKKKNGVDIPFGSSDL